MLWAATARVGVCLYVTVVVIELALALCVLGSTMVLIVIVDTNVEVPTFRAKRGDFFL